MQKNSTESDNQIQDTNEAFKTLLTIGQKIEFLTSQITAEISLQKNKAALEFLQKIKPKISKLAKLYQEELNCLEVIKSNKNNTDFSQPFTVPLFILEEKAWKQFNLSNPWKRLNLKKKTLLNLAIEQEREQQGLSIINHEKAQLKRQLEDWNDELSLLGVSIHYKTHSKLNQQEFEKLLNRFPTENKVITTQLALNDAKSALKKSNPTPAVVDIDVPEAIKSIDLVTQSNDLLTADTILLKQDEIKNIITASDAIANQTKNAELEYLQLKNNSEKKQLRDIDLSTIDEEIAELNSPKLTSGYLKHFFSDSLDTEDKEETTDYQNKKESAIHHIVENSETDKQRLLIIEHEIEDYIKKLHIVIKGYTHCDARLLEYLRVRIKSIVRLLIEKDFLLKYHTTKAPVELEHYIDKHLSNRITLFTTEILEPIQEILLLNIGNENKKTVIYNKKYKKNKPLKKLNDYDWDVFSKQLLSRIIN